MPANLGKVSNAKTGDAKDDLALMRVPVALAWERTRPPAVTGVNYSKVRVWEIVERLQQFPVCVGVERERRDMPIPSKEAKG